MTEEEAKQKLCHKTLFAALTVEDHKHLPIGEATGAMCIGSGCMAWRWTDRRAGHELSHWTYYHPDNPERAQAALDQFRRDYPLGLDGHCGLAGKP